MMNAPVRTNDRKPWWRWFFVPVVFLLALFVAPAIWKFSASIAEPIFIDIVPGVRGVWDYLVEAGANIASVGLAIYGTAEVAPRGRFAVALTSFVVLVLISSVALFKYTVERNWGFLAIMLVSIGVGAIVVYQARNDDLS